MVVVSVLFIWVSTQKYGGFPPKWMVKIMENPIKMDDLGGPPLFLETPICLNLQQVSTLESSRLSIFMIQN